MYVRPNVITVTLQERHFCFVLKYLLAILRVCCSEVQVAQSAKLDAVIESCRRNGVCLKGIISSPLHFKGGILQTLNMRLR